MPIFSLWVPYGLNGQRSSLTFLFSVSFLDRPLTLSNPIATMGRSATYILSSARVSYGTTSVTAQGKREKGKGIAGHDPVQGRVFMDHQRGRCLTMIIMSR